MATIMLDGLKVDLSDAEAVQAAFTKLETRAKDAEGKAAAAETQVAALTTDKATLDAKVVTLEQQLADAKLSPQQLRDAAKAYQAVADKAKALGVEVGDDMDEPAIMKAAVSAKLGDAAADWNEHQIAASFATLTVDVKPGTPALRIVPGTTPDKDVADAYQAMVNDMVNASKPQAA